jgi:putative PIN family toxin of toxin-antitoxin system
LLIQALAKDTACQIFFSDSILEETIRVLRDKFKWSQADLEGAEALVAESGAKVTPAETLDVVRDDPDDNRILECAIEAQADCIVTGDNDLLRLGAYGTVKILRPAELIELMRVEPGA